MPGDSRDPEQADFAFQRVVASRGGLMSPNIWLVLRRQPGADPVRVFLCHAPRRIKPARLAYLTGARWAIETCFREGRQLLGLSDYEGRSWQGWHRHTTLCLLLHFFLLRGRRALKKTTRPDAVPVAEALEAVLALFRSLRWDGRAHARRRLVEQPP